jgi:hypothetical protein
MECQYSSEFRELYHAVSPAAKVIIETICAKTDAKPRSAPAGYHFSRFGLDAARELAIMNSLETLLPGCRIHAQVGMGALMRVERRPGRCASPTDRNALSQKIVDFVIEDHTTGRIVALVEADDVSHREDRDRARDAMTAAAGYRTIRLPDGSGTAPSVVEPYVAWLKLPEVSAAG